MSSPSTHERGREFEDRAALFLAEQGLVLIDRNTRAGGVELDLILRRACDPPGEAPLYICVEVRSRTDAQRGDPAETIGDQKRRRLIRGTTAWLVRRRLLGRVAIRFDVVTFVGDQPHWITNAFEADE